MTSPILAVIYDDADLMAAERLMIDRSVRRLPVLRRQDNVVLGILSVDDFARAGQRRRAGEVIRGAASLAVSPETARKGGVKPIGEVTFVDTGTEVHSSIFKVRDIMSGCVECVFENDTCSDAAARMLHRAVGCLPVCAGDPTSKALSGIVTDRDIVIRAMATEKDLGSTKVRSVMSKNVACCFADDNLAVAEKVMIDRCVRRLPVIQRGTCELVGMLSVDDIALSASRGRAGRVIEHAAAKPNQVYMSTSAASAISAKPGQQA